MKMGRLTIQHSDGKTITIIDFDTRQILVVGEEPWGRVEWECVCGSDAEYITYIENCEECEREGEHSYDCICEPGR